MSHIPVVQGVAVPSGSDGGGGGYQQSSQQPYVPAGTTTTTTNTEPFLGGSESTPYNGVKGEQQPKQFKDSFFAILFIIHLIVVMVFLGMYSGGSSNGEGEGGGGSVTGGIIYVVIVCGIFAIVVSTITLGLMLNCAKELVKVSLVFSVCMSLVIGILGAMSGQIFVAIMGFASFALGCCYAYFVWARIPFAAANLNTAIHAVRANMGLAVVAYLFLFIAFAWALWWSYAAGGIFSSFGSGIIFLFLVSYYWTHQVLMNTVHVTVAGTIGTWWFVPDEASTFCSSGLMDSFVRATTFSFGSICFGSLLVALIQALRHLRHMLRDNDEFNFLVCIIDCILACIQSIIEYLNKWAYIYVGLYGYSYLEAGRNVITLFQNKGWTTIITDDLVDNVLFMMSIVIGLITGLVGLILTTLDSSLFGDDGEYNGGGDDNGDGGDVTMSPQFMGFIAGFLIGYLFASILMSVVGSAVNTVIVCFAESPAEFQQNHPDHSNEMRAAWVQAWPGEYRG